VSTKAPHRMLFAALLAAAVLVVPILYVHHTSTVFAAQEQAAAKPSGDQPGTTAADQTDLAVTVYNSSLALVRDSRQINLPAGEFHLRFMDIAASVNPATVHFRSLSDVGKLNVLEQNYEYDLLDPQKLLHKYVGHEVTLVRARSENNSTKYEEVKATLLADNNGPVWKIGNEIVTGMGYESIRFPDLPENLYSSPTLIWMLENKGAQRQRVEASYLTGNIAWSADYVLTVGRDEKSADLDGWVTLVNNSGTAFKNARLQLVAGELHRVYQELDSMRKTESNLAAPAPPAGAFAQESFSEYHLYSLNRRTTVADKESKQISLLNGSGVPVQKVYEVDGQQFYYHNQQRPGVPLKDPVHVYYKFKNEEKTGLGIPLPAGTVRVYQADSKGGQLFAGEDHIDHTPKDETISLHIGDAFDIVAERKQTDYKVISPRVVELEYEVTLRNHKDIPISVDVNEPIGGDWEMLNSSYKFDKTAAFAAKFVVPVEKNGTSVLKYRVRVKW
jgi:hypothetical protein